MRKNTIWRASVAYSSAIIALTSFGCNISQNPVFSGNRKPLLSNSELVSYDEEYRKFETKALTEAYLKKKLEKFLEFPVDGVKLVKEIEYARVKGAVSVPFHSLLEDEVDLYSEINGVSEVIAEKFINPPFAAFLDGYSLTMVTTFAGSGANSSTNGQGTNASFSLPVSLTVATDGFVYVTDYNNNSIRKITPEGDVTTFVSTSTPHDIDTDSSGNFYVANFTTNTISKITTDGNISIFAGSSGQSGTSDGQGTSARFNGPVGVAVDNNNNVYISEYYNNNIRKITPEGDVITLATTGFNHPMGIEVDNNGNVYVCNQFNHTINKVTPEGNVSVFAGSTLQPGTADGQGTSSRFNYPNYLTTDAGGNFYITDQSHRIRKMDKTGNVTTLTGTTIGYHDGPLTNAMFNKPYGIAADIFGNLYVADFDNRVIRKIE